VGEVGGDAKKACTPLAMPQRWSAEWNAKDFMTDVIMSRPLFIISPAFPIIYFHCRVVVVVDGFDRDLTVDSDSQ